VPHRLRGLIPELWPWLGEAGCNQSIPRDVIIIRLELDWQLISFTRLSFHPPRKCVCYPSQLSDPPAAGALALGD
jgi:hypothetical protein